MYIRRSVPHRWHFDQTWDTQHIRWQCRGMSQHSTKTIRKETLRIILRLTNARLIMWSNWLGSTMSLAREGMTACPENWKHFRIVNNCWKEIRTPAINKPNARPSLGTPWMPRSVEQGLQRLPGAFLFENPSNKITKIRRTVDMIPNIEA
jgi:hypothetical protein